MQKKIKRYELNQDVTVPKLLEVGFKEGGWHNHIAKPKISYECVLIDEIYMQIEMHIAENGSVEFDDIDNVDVFDNFCIQSYLPFYEEDDSELSKLPYLKFVINRYHEVMDSFVEKGILKEKSNQKTESSKTKKLSK